jgi:hypothetical protein
LPFFPNIFDSKLASALAREAQMLTTASSIKVTDYLLHLENRGMAKADGAAGTSFPTES